MASSLNQKGMITPTILVFVLTFYMFVIALAINTHTLILYNEYYEEMIYYEYQINHFKDEGLEKINQKDCDDIKDIPVVGFYKNGGGSYHYEAICAERQIVHLKVETKNKKSEQFFIFYNADRDQIINIESFN